MMQRKCLRRIRASRDCDLGSQQHAGKLARAVRCLRHGAFGVVHIVHHDNSGHRAQMQVRKLMARRQGSQQQFLRIPSRSIAAKHRIGRCRDRGFPSCRNLVRPLVTAISRRARPSVSSPAHRHCIFMLSRHDSTSNLGPSNYSLSFPYTGICCCTRYAMLAARAA